MISLLLASLLFDQAPKTKKKAKSEPAIATQTVGDVEVTVRKVTIKYVYQQQIHAARDPSRERSSVASSPVAGPFLFVHLEITNKSATKRLTFKNRDGWSAKGVATARDAFGNAYKRGDIPDNVVGPSQWYNTTINPGETWPDVVWFERPIEKADSITVTLPGKMAGVAGDFVFDLPKSKWEVDKRVEEAEKAAKRDAKKKSKKK